MAYPFVHGVPRVAVDFGQDLRSLFGFSQAGTMTSYPGVNVTHDGSSQNAEDWTVRLDNASAVGSALLDFSQSGSQIATSNYWWNTQDNHVATGNALDVANSPGPLWRALMTLIAARIAASRRPDAFMWSQGTTDMTADPTALATYETVLGNLFDAVRAAAGVSTLPIFINRIGRHQTANDAGAEGIRQAQRNVAAAKTRVYFSAEEYPYRFGVVGNKTGAGLTVGSNVVALADTSGLTMNTGVSHPSLPLGAFISAISTNVSVTLLYQINGVSWPANATATVSGQTIYMLDGVHLYPASDGVQPLDTAGGTRHNEIDGFYAVFKAAARRVAQVFGKGGVAASQGPYLSDVLGYTGATKVRAALTHVAGTDLVMPANSVSGWFVALDGVTQNLVGAERVDATHIDLLLGAPLFGTSLVAQYAWGAMNRKGYDGFIFDNATPVAFPVQAVDPISRAVATAPDGGGTVTVAAPTHFENAGALTAYTFTAAIPGPGRYILGVGTRKSAGAPVINALTAAGAIGRPLAQINSAAGNINLTAMYVVDAPSAGDVVVTFAAAGLRCGLGVWPITGFNPLTSVAALPFATTANPATTTLAVPAGGAVIGYLFGGSGATPTTTWSGATEDFDLVVSSTLIHSGGHAAVPAGGNVTVTATMTANGQGSGAIFVVIGPDNGDPSKIVAGAGNFALSGQAASLVTGRRLAAAPGSFVFSGDAMTPLVDHKLTAAAGSFALAGQAATLSYAGGATWTTVYDESGVLNGTDDGGGDGGATFVIVARSALLAAAAGKTKARVTIRYGSACPAGGSLPASFYFGQGASTGDEYDFAAAPVAVTFPSAITPGPNLEYVSDPITLPQNWDATKNYCLAFVLSDGAATMTTVYAPVTGAQNYYMDPGTNPPAQVDKSGGTAFTADHAWFLTKIEVSA